MDYSYIQNRIINFNNFEDAITQAVIVVSALFVIKSLTYSIVKYKKFFWSVLTALPVSIISFVAFVFYNFTNLPTPQSIELGFFIFLFGFIIFDFVLLTIFKWKTTVVKALLAATVSNLIIFIIILFLGIVYIANFVTMIPNPEVN